MSDHWQRDPVVRRYGGLLDDARATVHQRYLHAQLRYVFDANVALLHGADVGVDVDDYELLVTACPEPNALARRRGAHRAIVVHVGLLERLWLTVARAAHDPRVLPSSFPVESVVETTPSLDPAAWQVPEERADYLLQVFLFMLEYVVLHEIGHHVRGHLDLEIDAHASLHDEQLARADEPEPGSAPSSFALRDLEFDADVHGAELALTALNAQFPFGASWTGADALEHVFLLLYAHLLVAQQLTPTVSIRPEHADPTRHPAPIHRAINYSNLVTHTMFRVMDGKATWQAFSDAHDMAWTEASFIAEMNGHEPGLWHGTDFREGLMTRFAEEEALFFTAVRRLDALVDADARADDDVGPGRD